MLRQRDQRQEYDPYQDNLQSGGTDSRTRTAAPTGEIQLADSGGNNDPETSETEFTIQSDDNGNFDANNEFRDLVKEQAAKQQAEQKEENRYYTQAGRGNDSAAQAWVMPLFIGAVLWMLFELLNQ